PLLIDGHDVEADDVDLAGGVPEDRSRALPQRTREGDHHAAGAATLLADTGVLVDIGNRRAVVAGVADRVEVLVRLCRIGHGGTVVAGLAAAVAVRIQLVGVRHGGAVVAGVADPVGVGVLLARIGHSGTVVKAVPHSVPIGVGRLVDAAVAVVVD